jgi:hypothetical protein
MDASVRIVGAVRRGENCAEANNANGGFCQSGRYTTLRPAFKVSIRSWQARVVHETQHGNAGLKSWAEIGATTSTPLTDLTGCIRQLSLIEIPISPGERAANRAR